MNDKEIRTYLRIKNHYEFDFRPHLVPRAIKFIESKLNKEAMILELGSGSSTIWFARRVKNVISYEHDINFFNILSSLLDFFFIKNVELIYSPYYPIKGIRERNEKFDIILVDGRGRVKNTRSTVKYLKSGGYFILDDSNRNRYRPARALLNSKNWPCYDFKIEEENPFNLVFMTSIWRSL